MTQTESTEVGPITVRDEAGNVVWQGFGAVTRCSFAEASRASAGADRDCRTKEEATLLRAAETLTPTSGFPSAGAIADTGNPDPLSGKPDTRARRVTRASKARRADDPFFCASINHWERSPLSGRELDVLVQCAKHAAVGGMVTASQKAIAKDLGITRQRVSELFAALVGRGYLRTARRSRFETKAFWLDGFALWNEGLDSRDRKLQGREKAA